MRFSFKTLLLVVLIAALLTGGVVLPESSRVRVTKRVNQFEGAKIELTESKFSEKDPRRWFFGEDSGRYIQKLEFPIRYKRKPDQTKFAGFDETTGAQAIEKIICDWRGLTYLESLTLRTKFPTTKKAIEGLGRLKSLRFVWIEEAEIDTAGVMAISKLKNLEVLYLYNCSFSTEDFSALANLKHLVSVEVSRDPSLAAQVSDQALRSLRASASTAYVKLIYATAYHQQKLKEYREKIEQERQASDKSDQ